MAADVSIRALTAPLTARSLDVVPIVTALASGATVLITAVINGLVSVLNALGGKEENNVAAIAELVEALGKLAVDLVVTIISGLIALTGTVGAILESLAYAPK